MGRRGGGMVEEAHLVWLEGARLVAGVVDHMQLRLALEMVG